MNEFITINLGGYPVRVSSYSRLLHREQGDDINGFEPLSDFGYNSILFHNLGFNTAPIGLQWIESGKPIEWIAKESNNVLDIPMTKNKLMLLGPTSLLDLMRIVRLWGAGHVENGNILDYIHSFQLPEPDQIKYLIENGYKVSRKPIIRKKTDSWLTSNIEMRRLYNINPNIDEEYYENCFRNYTKYFREAIITNPIPLFVASIIDPDFLFGLIRESEIQAAKIVNAQKYDDIAALRKDEDMFDEFIKVFTVFEEQVNEMYAQEGAFAFTKDLRNSMEFVPSGSVSMMYRTHKAAMEDTKANKFYKLISEDDVIADLSMVSDYTDNELVENDRQEIFKYIDKKSLPTFLTDMVTKEDGSKAQSDAYNAVMIRLKRIITCLKANFPDMFDSKDKMIITKPFYMDENRFALYSKVTNEVIIATNDRKIYIMSPKNAIDLYKSLYNTKVLLDPKEIPPECSPAAPRMKLIGEKNENVPQIVSEPIPTGKLVNETYQTPQYDNVIGGSGIQVDEDGMIGINISNYVEQ